MKQQGVEIVSEPTGFKLLVAGTASWIGSAFASLDWAQVAGIVVAVVGLLLQLSAWRRNEAADKRERERHRMEMAILKRKLGDAAPRDFEVSES
jgi:membrane protein implicated in regulation of membrane protease activity